MGVRRCLARSLTSLALLRTPKSANGPRSNSFRPDSPHTTTSNRGRKTQTESLTTPDQVDVYKRQILEETIEAVLAANPQTVEEYRSGKTKVISYLVGQVMKQMKGKANPGKVNEILREKLEI